MNGRRKQPAPRGAELAAIAGTITETGVTTKTERLVDVIAEPGNRGHGAFPMDEAGELDDTGDDDGIPADAGDDEDDDTPEHVAGRRRSFAVRLAEIDARIAKLQDERTTLALFELADRAVLVPGAKPIARSLRAMLRAKMYPAAEAIALELDKRFPALAGGR